MKNKISFLMTGFAAIFFMGFIVVWINSGEINFKGGALIRYRDEPFEFVCVVGIFSLISIHSLWDCFRALKGNKKHRNDLDSET